MKSLKLNHKLAEMVIRRERTSTWRLFDDKDLVVNDEVQLIDKVDPQAYASWRVIGTATINKIVQKRMGELSDEDIRSEIEHGSRDDILAIYRRYYGSTVSWQTPVKIIYFSFVPASSLSAPDFTQLSLDKVTVYADGGSRGNPGPSASGIALYDENGALVIHNGMYLGVTTNNQAEYAALKLALEESKALGASQVTVNMDSMLVINQMKGAFKVRNRDLWPIHSAVKELCKSFAVVRFNQIPRELNKLADSTVNEVLDAHALRSEGGDITASERPSVKT